MHVAVNGVSSNTGNSLDGICRIAELHIGRLFVRMKETSNAFRIKCGVGYLGRRRYEMEEMKEKMEQYKKEESVRETIREKEEPVREEALKQELLRVEPFKHESLKEESKESMKDKPFKEEVVKEDAFKAGIPTYRIPLAEEQREVPSSHVEKIFLDSRKDTGAPTADAFGKQMLKQENVYSKGNVLMVGRRIPKNKGAYETDGVILYHSYCLGNHPYLIQDDQVELSKETVYICGHSDKKSQTISGYTMLELAGMLYYKCKYRGEQKIVIITCYGKYKNENKEDMADLLREGLETFGVKAEVEVFAQNTVVAVEYFGNAYVNDIPYSSYIFAKIQDGMLRKIGKHPLVLEMESYQREISEYIMSSGIEVARFNHSVIKKSRNKVTGVTLFLKMFGAVILVLGVAMLLAMFF